MRKHRMTEWRERAEISQHRLAQESSVDQGWISRVEAEELKNVRVIDAALVCIATARLGKMQPLALEDFLPDDLLQRYLKAMEG
jgi:transcriptional regulator with XRE-family HTH domain